MPSKNSWGNNTNIVSIDYVQLGLSSEFLGCHSILLKKTSFRPPVFIWFKLFIAI